MTTVNPTATYQAVLAREKRTPPVSRTGLRVYVAAPYTAGTPEHVERNVAAAVQAGDHLLAAGHNPYVPHLAHCWHTEHAERPYEAWMRLDLAWLAVAEALVRLPGVSAGADREVYRARDLGVPVFAGVEEFLAWAGRA